MTSLQRIHKNDRVGDAVIASLFLGPERELLEFLVSRSLSMYLCAGAARDMFLNLEFDSPKVRPRDWDICVGGISDTEFAGVMYECRASRNRYGGFRLESRDGKTLDFWRQERTVGTTTTGAESSIDNVLRSFVIECNAVAVDLKTGRTSEHGNALRCIEKHKVSLVRDAIFHDHGIFAAKVVSLSLRRGFAIAREAAAFVRQFLHPAHLERELAKNTDESQIESLVRRIQR